MKKLSTFLLTIGLTLSIATQVAAADLFDSYRFGDSHSAFTEEKGYYDCSAQMGMMSRCLDDIPFTNESFSLALSFTDNGLKSVTLLNAYDDALFAKVMGALTQSFTLVALQGPVQLLDMVQLSNSLEDKEKILPIVNQFEDISLAQGKLSYILVERPANELLKMSNSAEAVSKSPNDTRLAELTIFADSEVGSYLYIQFSLPKLEMERKRNN